MLDTPRSWLHLVWRAVVLLPLVNKQPGKWLGRRLRRSDDPARFWIMWGFGGFLIAIGGYEVREGAIHWRLRADVRTTIAAST